MSAFPVLMLATLSFAPSFAPSLDAAQADPTRCRVIRQTLERLRDTRARAANPQDAQPIDQQIQSLATQESAACGGAAPPPGGGTGSGTGANNTIPGGGGGGKVANSPALPVDPQDWASEWQHEFGTMLIVAGRADQAKAIADQQLRVDNALGPKVQCDGRAVFTGRVSWNRAGGGYDQPWNGQVVACTNGDFLEGKISNFGAHGPLDPDSSASFRIALTDRENSEFRGSYRVYDTRSASVKAEPRWSGSGGLTLETAVRRVLAVLARGRRIAAGPSSTMLLNGSLLASAEMGRASRALFLDAASTDGTAFQQATRETTCTVPLFGDLKATQDDERAMAAVLQGARQNAQRLADILERVLDDDAVNGVNVYVLLGREKPNLIYDGIAAGVAKGHKVLRYHRARLRRCQQQEKKDLEQWALSRELIAALVSDILQKSLETVGVPGGLIKLPLDYITLNQTLLQSSAPDVIEHYKNALTASKLLADAIDVVGTMTKQEIPGNDYRPLVAASVFDYDSPATLMLSVVQLEFVQALAKEYWKRYTTIDHTIIAPDIAERINAATTEGDWLKRFDDEARKQGQALLWHRSVLAAFNRIFDAQKWPTDPAKYVPDQPLLFGVVFDFINRYKYNQWSEARSTVVRDVDTAREQLILLTYFGGLNDVPAPTP